MLRVILLVLSVLFTNAHSAREEYIIGSLTSSIVDYPYHVAIIQDGNLWCTGSILTETKVLTSVNCVVSSVSHLTVHAGTSFWRKPGSIHHVVDYVINGFDVTKDLAIMIVAEPFVFDSTRQPVGLLASEDLVTPPGIIGNVTVWDIGDTGSTSTQLMSVKVPVIDRESCVQDYSGTTVTDIVDGQFCANVHANKQHQSSTGSPIVNHGNQIGIVAIGFGSPQYPTIYIDVQYFHKWIKEHLNDERHK